MTPARRTTLALAVAALLLLATACGPASLREEKALVEHLVGRGAVPETSLHIGPMLLGLARWADDEDDAGADPDDDLVKHLRRIDLVVYRLDAAARARLGHAGTLPLLKGWDRIVRVREKGEVAEILVRTENDRLDGMVVLAHEEDELVLVRIDGDIEPLIEAAMKEDDHPDRDGALIKIASRTTSKARDSH